MPTGIWERNYSNSSKAALSIKRITSRPYYYFILPVTAGSHFLSRAQSQSALQAITVISIINTTFISLLVYCNYLNLPAYPALLSATNSILCL